MINMKTKNIWRGHHTTFLIASCASSPLVTQNRLKYCQNLHLSVQELGG